MPLDPNERTPGLVFVPPKADGIDVSFSHFPLLVKFGDKEYLLVKSQLDKLLLNRKD